MPNKLQTIRGGGTAHPEVMVEFFGAKAIENSGVLSFGNGDFKVVQKVTPTLNALVSLGVAWIKKSDDSMTYPVLSTVEEYEVTFGANSSGNPRKDAVVLYIDLAETPTAGVENVAKFAVVAGTPATSPSSPSDSAISSSIGVANPFLRLADVLVTSGSTSITDANITDTRVQVSLTDAFSGFNVGDIKQSFNSSITGNWLLANGDTIGNDDSTADHKGDSYKALFDLLVDDLGYTPTNTWENNGKVAIPDTTDRVLVSAGGDYSVGATYGNDTHSHSVASEAQATTSSSGAHTHTYSGNTGGQQAVTTFAESGNDINHTDEHTHSYSGTTSSSGTHTHTVPAHDHGGVTGTTNNLPRAIAVYTFIKY